MTSCATSAAARRARATGVACDERDRRVGAGIPQEADEDDAVRDEGEKPASRRRRPAAVGPAPHGEEEKRGERGGGGRTVGREEPGVQDERRRDEGQRAGPFPGSAAPP